MEAGISPVSDCCLEDKMSNDDRHTIPLGLWPGANQLDVDPVDYQDLGTNTRYYLTFNFVTLIRLL